MHKILIPFIFLCAYNFFDVLPFGHIEGSFNTIDVGIAVIVLTLIFYVAGSLESRLVNNAFALLVTLLLFLVVMHAGIASIKYGQSIFQGAVASRNYFYYLTFFLFLIMMKTPRQFIEVMKILNVLATIAVVLGVANYFGPVFLHHKWAEGHYERAGIVRAYLPGMQLISYCAIWSFCNLFVSGFTQLKSDAYSFFFLAAHVFRQSRMRLMGVVLILGALMLYQRKFTQIAIVLFMVIAGTVIMDVVMEKNIIMAQIELTEEEAGSKHGSWSGREQQVEFDIEAFLESPLIGASSSALRSNPEAYYGKTLTEIYHLVSLAAQSDLGYVKWLKHFGIVGIVWLLMLYMKMFAYCRANIRTSAPEEYPLALFTASYFAFIVITGVTLNHWAMPNLAILLCFIMAANVRLYLHNTDKTRKKQEEGLQDAQE